MTRLLVWLLLAATLTAITIKYNASMTHGCFDAGRVVGGAEQRVFAAEADGYEALKSDVETVSKGPPEGCR